MPPSLPLICLLFALYPPIAAGQTIRAVQRPARAVVGDAPDHEFRTPLLDGAGLRALEDLRGRPTLVVFWGARCAACIDFAVPKAIKFGKQYGEDFALLFVDTQAASFDDMAAFVLERHWLGGGSAWTTELPFDPGMHAPPHFVLLSAEGRIVASGEAHAVVREIEAALEELVVALREGPPGAPDCLRAAWTAMHAGRIAEAMQLCRNTAGGGPPEEAALAELLLADFVEQVARSVDRAERELDQGFVLAAITRLERLSKGLEGEGALLARVEGLLRAARSRGTELAAERELLQVLAEIDGSGANPKWAAQLRRLAEEFRGTPAADRAQWFAGLLDR